jgi:hypothetical protein
MTLLCQQSIRVNFSLFWVITSSKVVWNRHFGTTYASRFQGRSSFFLNSLTLEDGTDSPETSISNHLTPRSNLEDWRNNLNNRESRRTCSRWEGKLERVLLHWMKVTQESLSVGVLLRLYGLRAMDWRMFSTSQYRGVSSLIVIETLTSITLARN